MHHLQSEQKPPVVALTGSIGSGKSALANELAAQGATIIDADELSREVVSVGTQGYAAVRDRFGPAVLSSDGSLDRSALAALVFRDPQKLKELEAILHPLIAARFQERLAHTLAQHPAPALVVYVVPLLFEKNIPTDVFQATILVSADDETKIARVMARDGITRDSVLRRLRAQLTDQEKAARANIVIENNGSVEELRAKSRQLFARLCSKKTL